jgi:hypothetical protein
MHSLIAPLRFLRGDRARVFVAVVLAGLLLGSGLSLIAADAGSDDRIVVGYTGGSLSLFARVDRYQVVIGGGDARTDLADLVGRSTVPWRRRIDLLLVPGWDARQALGALGLVESGRVSRVAVIGVPGDDPAWSALEGLTRARSASYDVFSGIHRVQLGQNELLIDGTDADAAASGWTTVSLRFHDVYAAYVNAAPEAVRSTSDLPDVPSSVHLLVAGHGLGAAYPQADLAVLPRANRTADLVVLSPRYSAELGPGQQLTVGLRRDSLRVPRNAVKLGPLDAGQ